MTREERLHALAEKMFRAGAFDEIVVLSLEEALEDTLAEIAKAPQENRSAAAQEDLMHNIDVGMALVTCARYFSGKQYAVEAEILNAELADAMEWDAANAIRALDPAQFIDGADE